MAILLDGDRLIALEKNRRFRDVLRCLSISFRREDSTRASRQLSEAGVTRGSLTALRGKVVCGVSLNTTYLV
jgi:hypothetical protein